VSRVAQPAAAGVEELVRGLGAQPQLARVFGSEEGFGARRTRFRKTQYNAAARAASPARAVETRRGTRMTTFTLNGQSTTVDADPSTPILWALRDQLGLTGTKFGCGMAQCGACTVHLNGQPVRSCVTPLAAAAGGRIATIEGIEADRVGKAVVDAWVKHDVAQCGYCQSGQVMSATALLKRSKRPTDAQIDQAMAGNVCRCGTYQRIRAAIKDAAASLA
jgi:isoquinoline 1-oxidoreductase alpha subunit